MKSTNATFEDEILFALDNVFIVSSSWWFLNIIHHANSKVKLFLQKIYLHFNIAYIYILDNVYEHSIITKYLRSSPKYQN